MTKEELKAIVREVIVDMSNTYGIATEMTGVANTTGNIAGYDSPWGSMGRRKLKDLNVDEDDDED